TRLHMPDTVAVMEHDQRLPLNLTHPVHRRLLRSQLDQNGRLELREAPPTDANGWIGRAHEVWVPLRDATAPQRSEGAEAIPAAGTALLHLPGAGGVLSARLL